MFKIVTVSEVQKKIGQMAKNVRYNEILVTSRGKGSMLILPYFEGCDDFVSEYRENYEMSVNRENLKRKYRESMKSGKGTLVI
ncbi:MAG: Uncharacterized protein G01um101418_586 [Parcubacteria group bacterium Gr01-1014_18]|nr:MAG: Uncharacterized protein Greene041636_123 [Parcubacteria group bacterium Greene0416_36]TSC80838.1 MAG: Uncharacterized protein G01um101418_586 [Parcubacteria group bacterium Gr01-1014_18]TSC99499.1 MAG: Uncharacterized protein Greene101420_166 [Parcubacteria group bacterium Greene1014_20]TSD07582.1 MAG: Uncharacterized protein Greene07142_39 [Parcubacteria group bacterium Greene0714_2]